MARFIVVKKDIKNQRRSFMIKFILAATLVFSSVIAIAHDGDHSPDVCSRANPDVCAHIGHMSSFTTAGEAQFVAHIQAPQNQQVSDVKIELWMPDMGHGSRPVAVRQFGVNKYHVTKAYFMMAGLWEVRVRFAFGGTNHEIFIPVNIVE